MDKQTKIAVSVSIRALKHIGSDSPAAKRLENTSKMPLCAHVNDVKVVTQAAEGLLDHSLCSHLAKLAVGRKSVSLWNQILLHAKTRLYVCVYIHIHIHVHKYMHTYTPP